MIGWMMQIGVLWILMAAAVVLAGSLRSDDEALEEKDLPGDLDPESKSGFESGAVGGGRKQQSVLRLNIVDGPVILVPRGKDLMASLAEHGILLPGSCGGRGECGMCRVRIVPGAEGTPVEEALLGAREILSGHRLGCQCVPNADSEVHLPPGVATAAAFLARVACSKEVGGDFRILTLEFPDSRPADLEGRKILAPWYMVELPGLHPKVLKAYTLAEGREMLIRMVPGGLVSGYLHELSPGSTVSLRGPYGGVDFETLGDRFVILAGGSGLAAARAVIMGLGSAFGESGLKSVKYRLCAGFRTRRDLPASLEAWGFPPSEAGGAGPDGLNGPPETKSLKSHDDRAEAAERPMIRCLGIDVALSECNRTDLLAETGLPEGVNSMRRGLAHELLATALADPEISGRHRHDLDRVALFACGPKAMLTRVLTEAAALGLKREKIIVEGFDS